MPAAPPAWYVVHARPKCEHLAAALMRELPGVESYCPRIRFQRSTRRGKVWFVEALFPGYLFVRFDPELSLRAVRHAQHVIRVVEFGSRLCAVPDAVIDLLRTEMAGAEVCEVSVAVRVGDTVEMAEGPMRGLRGIVSSIHSGRERVKILLEFLGRESLVEVPAAQLLTEQTPRSALAAGPLRARTP